jgi:hypothetical protein
MSKGALMMCLHWSLIFLGNNWQPKHVSIGLFEVTKTTKQTLV